MTDATSESSSLVFPRRRALRRIAVFASLGLVLAAMLAALFLVRTVDSQLSDISTTYEIRRQARELMLAISQAESGQRGYLIAHDQSYLGPYDRAVSRLSSTYESLSVLLQDSPEQLQRLKTLNPDLDAKRAEMAETISLMSENRATEAWSLVRTDTGLELMDRLNAGLGAIVAEEDSHLVERNSQMQFYRQSLVVAIFAALAGAAVLAYSLLSRSQRRMEALAEEQSLLRSQNVELEEHIRARTLEADEARAFAERERARLETLLQDTNHRIGNSLATVSSLLGLQLTRTTVDEVREALEAAQSRVQAIASAHRRLRLGADLETTNAAEFLSDVVDDLATVVPADKQVTFVKSVAPLVIPARDATTIGIVVSELVTNALKHAFPEGRGGTIWVRFGPGDAGVTELCVEDDGRGMSSEGSQHGGLGALIIRQLARQFGGDEPHYAARDGGGTSVTVKLPQLRASAHDS